MVKRVNSQAGDAGAEETLANKVAMLFDGSNAGGRFLAVSLASHGADIAIAYRRGHAQHARETKKLVEAAGRRCLIVPLQDGETLSKDLIRRATSTLGRLDIFIDNSSPPAEANGSQNTKG